MIKNNGIRETMFEHYADLSPEFEWKNALHMNLFSIVDL